MFRKERKITFKFDVCIENDEDKFYAYCPALNGVHIHGATQEEAIENVKKAISLYIQSLIKHGNPIPLQTVPVNECQGIREGISSIYPPQQRYTESVSIQL